MIFLVDVDDTLANASTRMRIAGNEPSRADLQKYQQWLDMLQSDEALLADEPIRRMVQMVRDLKAQGNEIVYLTGRAEKYREVTQQWLDRVGAPKARLLMRDNDCYATAAVYKERQIKSMFTSGDLRNVVAIDDDLAGDASGMYRRLGIVHLKVLYLEEVA